MTSFPIFLLQSGEVMAREKIACAFSDYPVQYCSYEKLDQITKEGLTKFVPVGSVEFVQRYCEQVGIPKLPPLGFQDLLDPYLHRKVRLGVLSEASPEEFVKPSESIKLFTGCRRSEVPLEIPLETPVLISDFVPFESEFRFYIHDFVPVPKVFGWARYDDNPVVNPEPDVGLVERIAKEIHDYLGPNSYSIDIGWRPDIGRYSLVEVNDGWSLGLYENRDPQSSPPSRKEYAEMLVSRWRQIVFCCIA
jgi:hypothetical protein